MAREAAPTGPAAPLIALHAVALDTETTGLDVRTDRLVQIGALRLTGAETDHDDRFDALVDPGVPIPELASRIHGLRDADVAGAETAAEALARLLNWMGDAVVVGHSIHFDLALMRHEAHRAGLAWRDPAALDTGLLAAGLNPGLVDTSLDALAVSLGVAIAGRHTAFGDAEAAARVYVAMQPQLLAAGVRTLAQAQALCRKPEALLERQRQAGWFARPDERPDFAAAAIRLGAARAIDGFLYRNRIDSVMGAPPHCIEPQAPLVEAARKMTDLGIGCLIVAPLPDGSAGIVTERDVLGATASGKVAALSVADVMSAPVIAAPADTLLYRALGKMARRNLRYLGVTGPDGSVCGVFTLRTLLRQRALATLTVGDEIATASRPRELAKAQAALPRLAASLMADGLSAREVAAVISAEGRAMTARAAEMAEAQMREAGRGPAPAGACLLMLGSGGRGESLLAPDQDNALVVEDAYAGDLDAAGDWFADWTERVNAILDRAGVPFCKGGVMAKMRPWRRRLSEWRDQLAAWAARPTPQALLNVDIFYDFAPVHAVGGGARLADALRKAATETALAAPAMVRALGEQAGDKRPALGLFGRLRTDDRGRIDLKGGGLLPIVTGARAMALRRGVAAVSTPERLTGAAQVAGRGEADAAMLGDVHLFLMRLILGQQVADIDAGMAPTNHVDVRRLTAEDRDHLREALRRLEPMQEMVRDVLAD